MGVSIAGWAIPMAHGRAVRHLKFADETSIPQIPERDIRAVSKGQTQRGAVFERHADDPVKRDPGLLILLARFRPDGADIPSADGAVAARGNDNYVTI